MVPELSKQVKRDKIKYEFFVLGLALIVAFIILFINGKI